jgi:hypothetical protein
MTTADRAAIHALLDELLDATERERAANSDEAREAAQEQVTKLHRKLLADSGVLAILQRRCVAHMQGKLTSANVSPAAFPTTPEEFEGIAGDRMGRAISSVIVYDSGLVTERVGAYLATKLYAASKGYTPAGNEEGEHGGDFYKPEGKPGPQAASEYELHFQNKVVLALGYEAGARGLPTSKRLIPDLLDAVTSFWRRLALRSKGQIEKRSPDTIKGWCNRLGSDTNALYEAAYSEGRADKATGRIQPSKRLAALVLPPRN